MQQKYKKLLRAIGLLVTFYSAKICLKNIRILLTFYITNYIIGQENKREQNVVATYIESEVVRMVQQVIISLLILSIYANVLLTIIAVALIIVLVIIISK